MPDTAEIAVKPKLSAKDEVRALLDRLPDNVTLEDIASRLDVVVKVLEAEAQLDRGRVFPTTRSSESSTRNGAGSNLVTRSTRRPAGNRGIYCA